MKLLVLTQKVDEKDAVLGFFVEWLDILAKNLEKVAVICQEKGAYNLPSNVEVFSLNKERNGRVKRFFIFQWLLWKNLKTTENVLCHMCPIYVILAWPLCFLFRKKIILWYVHKSKNIKLWLANKFAYRVLTASETSVSLKNRERVVVLGHGINTDFFQPAPLQQPVNIFNILYVGRIAPIKHLETIIEALDILIKQKNETEVCLTIAGDIGEVKEKFYKDKIINLIKAKGLENYVKLYGSVPHKNVLQFYQITNVLINACPTGGLDKAVLEAMACELPVLVSNLGFAETLGRYKEALTFKYQNPADLAQKILLIKQNQNVIMPAYLREQVIIMHNLSNLIKNIIKQFNA